MANINQLFNPSPPGWDPERIEIGEGMGYKPGWEMGASSSRPGYMKVNQWMTDPSNRAYQDIKNAPGLIQDPTDGWILPQQTFQQIIGKYDDRGGDRFGNFMDFLKPFVPAAIGTLAGSAYGGFFPLDKLFGGGMEGGAAGGVTSGGGGAGFVQEAAHAGADLGGSGFLNQMVAPGASTLKTMAESQAAEGSYPTAEGSMSEAYGYPVDTPGLFPGTLPGWVDPLWKIGTGALAFNRANESERQLEDLYNRLYQSFDQSDPFAPGRALALAKYMQYIQDPNKFFGSPEVQGSIDLVADQARRTNAATGRNAWFGPQGQPLGSGGGAIDFAEAIRKRAMGDYGTYMGQLAQQAGMQLYPNPDFMGSAARLFPYQAGLAGQKTSGLISIGQGIFGDNPLTRQQQQSGSNKGLYSTLFG